MGNFEEEYLEQINKMETTNHIIIECEDEKKGYEIFEEVQNFYSLYDNCVIDLEEDKSKPHFVTIEGKNIREITDLAKNILLKYYPLIKELKISVVPIEDTIIDEDRREETGD